MMAASPKYKIYRGKEYVASVKYLEDAALLVSLYQGSTVRLGHKKITNGHNTILWHEGEEGWSAEDNDAAANVMKARASDITRR